MKKEEVISNTDRRYAERLRRLIYWGKFDAETCPMDPIILEVITRRLWSFWGYKRLLDCLLDEFRLPPQRAMELTKAAVENGHERRDLYGSSTTRE